MHQLHIYNAHLDFTTAQIVTNCMLKYALVFVNYLAPTSQVNPNIHTKMV